MSSSDSLYTLPKPKPLHSGLDSVAHSLIGRYRRRDKVKEQLLTDAEEIDRLGKDLDGCEPEVLEARIEELSMRFRRGAKPGDELQALAVVREVADQKLGLRPFVVQLAGALALYRGFLAEMATGEGKTLTAGLAAVLLGWTRKPCHIITVNDYLVERDADWLKPLYDACGVTVGSVTGKLQEAERREAYSRDITYTTSKELLADVLRDQMKRQFGNSRSRRLLRKVIGSRAAMTPREVLRGIHSVIVDEADSVLVDEAVTPLIISTAKPNESLKQAILRANEVSLVLESPAHYKINEAYREVELTAAGSDRVGALAESWRGIWRSPSRREELVRQSLVARTFFERDKQYLVQGNKVVIIDEFTGRPMPQRSWRQGLHQAIEAKEGVPLSDPSETVARMSFQQFFRCFTHMSGMSGTGFESANEFWRVYQLPVVSIPPNRPCIRDVWSQVIVRSEEEKWRLLIEEVERVHAEGRPVLIGTRNVEVSEKVGSFLKQAGLSYQLLNATKLAEEAGIVAEAGRESRITVATNMAGRGTDIRLDSLARERGGLHVIATEFHEAERIDRQLFGRCARQGDPGTARMYASLDDELLAGKWELKLARGWGRIPANMMPQKWWFRSAQRRSERQSYARRLGVLRSDRWLEESLSFASKAY